MQQHAARSIRDVAVLFGGFLLVWTGAVALLWNLALLEDPARWLARTALWLGAVALWLAWRRQSDAAAWLGLWPVRPPVLAIACAAFAAVLAWNLARVTWIETATHQLAGLGLLSLARGLVGVVLEELLFRGAVQTRLAEALPPAAAIVIASLLFTAIHVPGWLLLAMPVGIHLVASVFLIGVVCGVLRHLTSSLWPAVAAHWANSIGALL